MSNPLEDPFFSVWLHAFPDVGRADPATTVSSTLGTYARTDPNFPYPASALVVSDYVVGEGLGEAAVAVAAFLFVVATRCRGDC